SLTDRLAYFIEPLVPFPVRRPNYRQVLVQANMEELNELSSLVASGKLKCDSRVASPMNTSGQPLSRADRQAVQVAAQVAVRAAAAAEQEEGEGGAEAAVRGATSEVAQNHEDSDSIVTQA
ncbi:hypothetical protein FOZ61_003388, partial [Perkinsus olseni]